MVPIFLVTCLTGIALIYQKAIVRVLVTPDASLPADYGIDQLSVELEQLVQHQMFRADALIKAPNTEEPYWWIRYPGEDKLLFRLGDLEQYEVNNWVLPAFEFVRHLHIELLTGLAGEIVLLYVAAMALVLGFSGLWLWWPMRRGFHWRWVIPPVRRLKLKSFLRFHSQSSVVILPMFLVVTLTASVMMFQKVRNAITAETTQTSVQASRAPIDPDQLVAAVQLVNRTVQNSWPTYIRVVPGDAPVAKVRLRLDGEWHSNGRTNVYVDMDQTVVTKLQHVDDDSSVKKVLNQMYPLHSSYGMPLFYSLLTLSVGIGVIWLIVTGTGSWLRRRYIATPVAKPAAAIVRTG